MSKTIKCKTVIVTEKCVYTPEFNPINNDYYDKKYIYSKGTRGYKTIYTCRCKWGSEWVNNAGYTQHIKSDTHKKFVKDYHIYYKEVDNQENVIKELRIKIECMKKILEAQLKNNQVKKKLKATSSILTELD